MSEILNNATNNIAGHTFCCIANEDVDIYYTEAYGKLYEEIENGKYYKFETVTKWGTVIYPFIKRSINTTINGEEYFDLITPYGYGGPFIYNLVKTKSETEHRKMMNKILSIFDYEIDKFCKENNIVSEFIRFHPIFSNHIDFTEIYDVDYLRNTVGTNLERYPDFYNQEYSKKCRYNIRKAQKNNVTVVIEEAPINIDEFKKCYYSTMNRNNASEFYFFPDTYFDNCLATLRDNILLAKAVYEGETIAAGIYFLWNDILIVHLSGTLAKYLYLSPAYLLRFEVSKWAQTRGFRLIHHGGGTSNDQEDKLFTFKKQFGKNTLFKYFIGKKIRNIDVYNKMCENIGLSNSNFFPAYRYFNNKD